MEASIQHDEAVIEFWNELMEENEDAFETDMDRIFFAMKIDLKCIDIGRREGWLALEEFADSGCGVGKGKIPLWEYFKATVWIVVMVSCGEPPERIRMMLGTLLSAYHYTGYQVVQGFVYLTSALMLLESERPDRALIFFRSLVPDKEQETFDIYFQPVLEQLKA